MQEQARQGREAGAHRGLVGHDGRRQGAGSGAGVGADGVEGGDDGEVDQPDGVGGGGDDEVEQPDGSAATATRQSSERRAEKKGMDFGETAKC